MARSEPIVFSCTCGHGFAAEVPRVVDARDSASAERATAGSLQGVSCPSCGTTSPAEVPFVYHDDRTKTCILVLPAGSRHRELEERAAFLLELARSGQDVPRYVREFKVTFAAAGLSATLAELRRDSDRAAELDVREGALKEREDEHSTRGQELGPRRRAGDPDRRARDALGGAVGQEKELDER